MTHRLSIFLLRITMGILFFYSGVTKILDRQSSLSSDLASSRILPDLYQWLGATERIFWTNQFYEWGLAVVGLLLALGLFTRLSALFGIAFTLLIYFPSIQMTIPRGLIVNENLVYAVVLLVLITAKSGLYLGVDKFMKFSFRHKKK